MIGPAGSSLLHKMNQLIAHEMPYTELLDLVRHEQLRRTHSRAHGRIIRMAKDNPLPLKVNRLDQLGLTPIMIAKLQLANPGKSEPELIKQIQEAGLL